MSAVVLDKCVVLHVPKTGGTWLTGALQKMGVVYGLLNDPEGGGHPSLRQVRDCHPSAPIVATVRHPAFWLQSFWRFFYKRAWRDGGSVDWGTVSMKPLLELASPNFAEFAQRYLNRRPGYVSELLNSYVDGADFVVRQESLGDDVQRVFTELGQPFLPSVFDRFPRQNVSPRFDARLPDDVHEKLLEADAGLVGRYYGDS